MAVIPAGLRIGYAPYEPTLQRPGDRRRFVFYAQRRGLAFDLADPRREYDLIVLSARADIGHWARLPSGTRIVYDLIDSYLALPRFAPRSVFRGVAKFVARETRSLLWSYRRAIERMCRRADAVVCCTPEQRAALLPFCTNVHVVLDAHGEMGEVRKTSYELGSPIRIGWEGQAYTVDELRSIGPTLSRLARRWPIELHLVTDPEFHRYASRFGRTRTADRLAALTVPVRLHPWSVSNLMDVMVGCDVAVVPLDLANPFAAGKPENKLLLLWRLAVPTVTSATPAYRRVMEGAGLDLTFRDPAELEQRLTTLLEAKLAERAELAARGRAYAETHHADEQVLARWDAVFASVLR